MTGIPWPNGRGSFGTGGRGTKRVDSVGGARAESAVAVRVARKDRGRVVILAHVGSAHTDAELGILLDEARHNITGEQAALAIEVPACPSRVADVPDWRTSTLKPTPAAAMGAPVGSGRTAATHSRLLYDVLGAVYDWLGFDAVADQCSETS